MFIPREGDCVVLKQKYKRLLPHLGGVLVSLGTRVVPKFGRVVRVQGPFNDKPLEISALFLEKAKETW